MTTSLPPSTNFRENYFQHPELTKITGEPTHTSLTTLINELKANAQSVHSNLGGGAHGHLGLVLSPVDYASVAQAPYVRPQFPGSFVIPPNITNVQAQMLREQHAENLRQFQEVEAVHNALVQQVIQAVDPMYLKALRNPITNALNVPLNKILQHLIDVYGTITPREFQAKRDELTNFHYNVSLPVDVVFTPIDDLADLARFARQPMSDEQKIGLAYIIFQNAGCFKSDLKAWNRLQIANQTWPRMKQHFREALENIRATAEVNIEDTSFNQINMVNEVLAGVKQIVTDQVNEVLPTLFQAQTTPPFAHHQANNMPQAYAHVASPSVVSPSIAPSITQPSISTMNSTPPPAYIPQTINTTTQPHPHQTTQQPPWSPFPYPAYAPMSQPPTQQQQPFVPVTNGGFSNYSGRRNNKNNKNKRNNNTNNQNVTNMPNFTNMPYQPPYQAQPQMQQHYQFFNPTHQQQSQAQPQMQQRTFLNGNKNISRRTTSQYCWSHGACAHNGYQCQRPKQGHVPWATFTNRCGGCNDFCA